MKLSARSRYAIRLLLELAQQKDILPISAAMLSQQTGISTQFVEQILKPLRERGFTASIRGAAGGHTLACSVEEIFLGEVVRLMEGNIDVSVCFGEKANDCPQQGRCATSRIWGQISSKMERELDSVSLAELLSSSISCFDRYKNKRSSISGISLQK